MASILKYQSSTGATGYRIQWFAYDGKRKSKVLYLTLKQVRIIAERLDREAREIQEGFRPLPDDAVGLSTLTQRFLESSKLDGHRPKTLLRYQVVFKPLLEYFGNSTPIQSITSIELEEYKSFRSTQMRPVSLNTELRHLKSLFSWAVKLDYLVKSPFISVNMVKVASKKVRFLSKTEIKSLYDYIDKTNNTRAWDLVTFYLQTGVRATEILEEGGFTWQSVKSNYIDITGKGQKHRRIPLNDTLREILNRRRNQNERAPFPYTYSAVSQSISRRLLKSAGIENANLHTLRKTAGALLIQNGVDIYRVSKFLGHSSVKVTEQHYVDLLDADYSDMSSVLEQMTPAVSEPHVVEWRRVA